jgi:hypothetical protein
MPSHTKYLEDEEGNIIELQEIEAETVRLQDDDLVFFDERKELVKEANLFGTLVSRLTILMVALLVCFVWVQDYVIRKAWENISYTWVLVFLGSQLASYLILQPLFLFVNAFCFANRVY